MRLYLSSFRMGDHPEHLVTLAGQDSRKAVVIANAIDDATPDVRRAGAELELAALGALGFDAVELDLRDYFTDQQRLRRDLAGDRRFATVTATSATRTAKATARPPARSVASIPGQRGPKPAQAAASSRTAISSMYLLSRCHAALCVPNCGCCPPGCTVKPRPW